MINTTVATPIFAAATPATRRPQSGVEVQPQETFATSSPDEHAPVTRPNFVTSMSTTASPGLLSRLGRSTGMRALALVGIGLMALSLTGCNDQTPNPSAANAPTAITQPAVTAISVAKRLEELKTSNPAGYAAMAEAGYYHQLLESISKAKPEAAKEGKTVQQMAQEAAASFDFKGTPESQQTAMSAALQAIVAKGPGVSHDAAQAGLKLGQEFNKGLANAPTGWLVQTKASLYDKSLEEAIKQLPGIPASLNAKTGVSPTLISDYVDMLSLEAKSALEFSRQVNDPGMSVVLIEGTANLLYGQVQSNAQLVNTQFGAALSVLKKLF